MSDLVRFELSGANAEIFERVFEQLAVSIEQAFPVAPPDAPGEGGEAGIRERLTDLLKRGEGYAKAKLDNPGLENEKLMVEIAKGFEELKQEQLATDRKQLKWAIDQVRVRLQVMASLSQVCQRDEEGNLQIVVSKEALPIVLADLRALSESLTG